MSLAIEEGKTTDQILQTGDRDYRALSFQIKIMMEQIEAVKVLQKKA